MAPRWSRSPTEGRRREDGAEEGSGYGLGLKGEDGSPPSQASAWSRSSTGIEEDSGIDGEDRGGVDSAGNPHPERPSRRRSSTSS